MNVEAYPECDIWEKNRRLVIEETLKEIDRLKKYNPITPEDVSAMCKISRIQYLQRDLIYWINETIKKNIVKNPFGSTVQHLYIDNSPFTVIKNNLNSEEDFIEDIVKPVMEYFTICGWSVSLVSNWTIGGVDQYKLYLIDRGLVK